MSPAHGTSAVNRWVSDGHVYFIHKVQPLAQSESDSGTEAARGWAAGMGWEWRKEQEGRVIRKEMTRLRLFCFHNLRHASARSEPAAGQRTAAHAGSGRAPASLSPSRSGVLRHRGGLREAPQDRSKWGLGWSLGAKPRMRNFSHPAPLDGARGWESRSRT